MRAQGNDNDDEDGEDEDGDDDDDQYFDDLLTIFHFRINCL